MNYSQWYLRELYYYQLYFTDGEKGPAKEGNSCGTLEQITQVES